MTELDYSSTEYIPHLFIKMNFTLYFENGITEAQKDICKAYWMKTTFEDKRFTHLMSELTKLYGYSQNKLSALVKDSSYIIVDNITCHDCNIERICRTRTQYTQTKSNEWRCLNCYRKYLADEEALKQSKRLAVEAKIKREKELTLANFVHYRTIQTSHTPSVDEINIIDHYLVVTVLRAIGFDNTLNLDFEYDLEIGPSLSFNIEVIKRLFSSGILTLELSNIPKFVTLNNEKELKDIVWELTNFEFVYNRIELQKLKKRASTNPYRKKLKSDHEYEFWGQQIYIQSCLNYLHQTTLSEELLSYLESTLLEIIQQHIYSYSILEMQYLIEVSIESLLSIESHDAISSTEDMTQELKKYFLSIAESNIKFHTSMFHRTQVKQSAVLIIFFDNIFNSRNVMHYLKFKQFFEVVN